MNDGLDLTTSLRLWKGLVITKSVVFDGDGVIYCNDNK
jgi:hypothetical protein